MATVSSVFSDVDAPNMDLQLWCVAALFGRSRGSCMRFCGLARAISVGHPVASFAEHASPDVHREMVEMSDDNNSDLSE
jgi:hypothetical protein